MSLRDRFEHRHARSAIEPPAAARARAVSAVPVAVGALVALLAMAAGCSKHPTSPPPAALDTPPSATSPENALLRFKWGWTHRDPAVLRSLLTADFSFVFGAMDSTGHAYPDGTWGRETEDTCDVHLFTGGSSEPPLTSVNLTFDPTLLALRDVRPGHDPRVHRTVTTSVALTCRTSTASFETQGRGLFYFTRGDSASIPADEWAAGARPDSTRWWMDRWEDQTLSRGGGGLTTFSTQPARSSTWGQLKALYR